MRILRPGWPASRARRTRSAKSAISRIGLSPAGNAVTVPSGRRYSSRWQAVQAEMPPESTPSRMAVDLNPVVLQIRVEYGAQVGHDHDKVSPPLVHDLAQRRESRPGPRTTAVVRGGQIQQQLVTGSDQRGVLEGQLPFRSPGRSSCKIPLSR